MAISVLFGGSIKHGNVVRNISVIFKILFFVTNEVGVQVPFCHTRGLRLT